MFTSMGNGMNPLEQLRGEVDRLFGNWWERVSPWVDSPGRGGGSFPPLNVWEDDTNLYVEAEIPGLAMEAIEILAAGRELTIKGERKDPQEADVLYHRRERGVGAFTRVLRLPADVDTQKVEASLKAGVLTLTLPKAEAAKLRKIQVKAS